MTLKFGDVVSLYTEDHVRGFMSAEGTVKPSLELQLLRLDGSLPVMYRECLFRVYPMSQYSARQELRDALQSGQQVDFARYDRNVAKENAFNQQEYERRIGRTVK